MNVRIYGETAVITGRSPIKVKGQDVSGEYRFTHVWIKRSDRWQVVASQVTRIADPEQESLARGGCAETTTKTLKFREARNETGR